MQESINYRKPWSLVVRDIEKFKIKGLQVEAELQALYLLGIITQFVPGSMADCGCYQGRSSYAMTAGKHKHKMIYLFDSFKGYPHSELPEDAMYPQGYHKTSSRQIEWMLRKGDQKMVLRPYTQILYKGWIPDTLKNVEDKKFSLVNIDVRHYQSTKDCLEFFWPRLSEKGFLCVGDFYDDKSKTESFRGAWKATNEFFGNRVKFRSANTWRAKNMIAIRKSDENTCSSS